MSEYFTILIGPEDVDAAGFRARRAGLEVRDCICIQRPGGPVFALVVRGPLEGTVVEEMVSRGRGALNIDPCRISTTDSLDGGDTSSGKRGAGYGDRPWMHDEERLAERKVEAEARVQKAENLGRWPANLILVHGPSCECVGTKKVTGGMAHKDNQQSKGTGQVYSGVWNPHGESGKHGYVDEDGKEEVADWCCQLDCPVALLDAQSGALRARGNVTPTKSNLSSWFVTGGDYQNATDSGDEGGASRFFYQATSLDDLESYLIRLTGNVPEHADQGE